MPGQEITPIPTCGKEVTALMAQLDFPTFSKEVIRTISMKEGRAFAVALAKIANNEPDARAKHDYISAVCAAVSPMAAKVLDSLGIRGISTEQLIDISKQEGNIFRTSLRQALENTASAEPAKKYLQRLLGMLASEGMMDFPMHMPAPSRSAAPPAAAKATPPMAPPATQQHSSSARAQRPPLREVPPPLSAMPAQQPETQDKPTARFESYHIYGGKAAFCFSIDSTKGEEKPTIRIEAAKALSERNYDWEHKISFQLTVAELPLVYGVFIGQLESVELVGHGRQNEKAFTIVDQGGHYFLSMRSRGIEPIAAPAPAQESFVPMSMLWRQIKANSPSIESNILVSMIKRVCEIHLKKHPKKAAA